MHCSPDFKYKNGACICVDGKFLNDEDVCESCPKGCTLCKEKG